VPTRCDVRQTKGTREHGQRRPEQSHGIPSPHLAVPLSFHSRLPAIRRPPPAVTQKLRASDAQLQQRQHERAALLGELDTQRKELAERDTTIAEKQSRIKDLERKNQVSRRQLQYQRPRAPLSLWSVGAL